MQRPARNEDDRGEHPANCPAAKDTSLPRKDWEAETFLMRRFNTEAIRVVIPVVGELEDDDVKSFIAGIILQSLLRVMLIMVIISLFGM